jgi:hypothetical protein
VAINSQGKHMKTKHLSKVMRISVCGVYWRLVVHLKAAAHMFIPYATLFSMLIAKQISICPYSKSGTNHR